MRTLIIGLMAVLSLGTASAAQQKPSAPAAAAPVAKSESQVRLPVKRVVLYKNGVGYFEHAARVRGSQDLVIDFTTSQLNDVLKSLTVVDLGDGKISSVRYNSIAPLEERLKTLRIPVGGQTSTASFLAALRGARVEVRSGAGRTVGRLLTVESVQRPAGKDLTYTVTQLSVVGDDGEVRTFDLTPGTGVRVLEGELKEEVGRYLNLIGSARDRDVRRMTVSASGSGERPVFVSYISEVPIWKSTYRIVLPSDAGKKPLLQGWAIVDNTTGEDWKDVRLSLVAGAPQSFIQDISRPYYGRRPVIALPEAVSVAPQQHEASLTDSFYAQVPVARNTTGLFYAAPGETAQGSGGGIVGGIVSGVGGGALRANANLTGTVYDVTGAVVAGARVTLRAPNRVQAINTDNEGHFAFSRVPPGFFSVLVERQGFKSSDMKNIEVVNGRTSAVRVTLEPGSSSETVEVSSSAVTVDTASAAVGIGGSAIEHQYELEPEAISAAVGDLFEYDLKQRISIGKNQSALVPIIQEQVEAEKVTVWSAAMKQPRRSIWLKNASELTLDAGTFNVQEGGTFAGEGLLEVIHPSEKRLLSYAVDKAVHGASESNYRPQPVTRVRIVKGLMLMTREEREKWTYTVRNADTTPRCVVVEHPRRAGWTIAGDLKPAESSESYDRFRVDVAPSSTAKLEFEESRPQEYRYVITNLTSPQIEVFIRDQSIKPNIEAALRKVLNQKGLVDGFDRQISERKREIESIYAEQTRLRENMKVLKGSSEERALLQRYTRELDGQEDRIGLLRKEIAGLESQKSSASAALDQMVTEIALDETL